MQNPFSLNFVRFVRDPLQSLSDFYSVVLKLNPFSVQISNPRCQLLVKKRLKTRLEML